MKKEIVKAYLETKFTIEEAAREVLDFKVKNDPAGLIFTRNILQDLKLEEVLPTGEVKVSCGPVRENGLVISSYYKFSLEELTSEEWKKAFINEVAQKRAAYKKAELA